MKKDQRVWIFIIIFVKKGNRINYCEGFCNEVIQMLVWGTLRIKGAISIEVSMIDETSINKEVCQVKFTIEGLPKLIIWKPTVASKENYSALPHNYGYSSQSV
jgi:hypothetical protein